MAQAVTFVYADWILEYPEFASVLEPQAQRWFNRAGLYIANSESSPLYANDTLLEVLYMVTAHIAALFQLANGQAASTLVGRISNASEGSVSVATEWQGSGSPSEQWWTQTKYGASVWQAIAQYRTFRCFSNPTVVYGGITPLVSTRRGR